MTDLSLWKEDYFIAHFFVGPDGLSTVHGLSYFLIEAAANHAIKGKLGYNDLAKNDKAWVMNRQKIRIFRQPEYTETIRIETWIHETTQVYSIRDFHVYDEKGSLIALARTSWMLMDLQTRRPVAIPDQYLSHIPRIPDRLNEDITLDKIPMITEKNVNETAYTVVYSDLDMNHHVNNVSYLRWVLDDFSFDFRMKNLVSSVEINYRQEALFGEKLKRITIPDPISDHAYITNIISEKNKHVILAARSNWLEKN